jgi:hypothetical protein
LRVAKFSCCGCEKPIDLDARVVGAIRFELKNPFHQSLFASCRVTALSGSRGTAGSARGVPIRNNVAMDSSFRNGVLDCQRTIWAFDRDAIPVERCYDVLAQSIPVRLTDNKRRR